MAINKTITLILDLQRWQKKCLAISLDILLSISSVWISLYLRLGEFSYLKGSSFIVACMASILLVSIMYSLGIYNVISRYIGSTYLQSILFCHVYYGLLFFIIISVIGFDDIPRTVGIIQPIVILILVLTSRLVARYWLSGIYKLKKIKKNLPNTYIYGAGSAGRELARALSHSNSIKIAGFMDDDPTLYGREIQGLQVYDPKDLPILIQNVIVDKILLAIPSASQRQRKKIIEFISCYHLPIFTVPSFAELSQASVSISDLRELGIEDLTGREIIEPDRDLLKSNILAKSVLITGAGGSIGSELCRKALELGASELILLDNSEYLLYNIYSEINSRADKGDIKIYPILASVLDKKKIVQIIKIFRPNTIYHAAAYKHVPLVEFNLMEGLKNNVLGTEICASAAKNIVNNFILISTDKAVRPTNVMGASKRLSEIVVQSIAENSDTTIFSIVRFGNVINSSGSVIPLFRKQIRDGGPVTITHPEITRYFMSIPEAAELVIQSGAMSKGSDLFLLNMGQPVKLIDLAYRMIELSGLSVRSDQNPEGDIQIDIIGLRPGEKLYEELLINDQAEKSLHPKIFKANEKFENLDKVPHILDELSEIIDSNDYSRLHSFIKKYVEGYQPQPQFVDLLYNKGADLFSVE